MLIVISPAKSLDYSTATPFVDEIEVGTPDFMAQSAQLITLLKPKSALEIRDLMHISEPLALLNKQRFAAWKKKPTQLERAAIFAFNGDVYEGLDAYSLNLKQLNYLQQKLSILSGLYGVLRPFDALQAYRLEMGTRLENPKGSNLYAFWDDQIAHKLIEKAAEYSSKTLLNLASEEYFKAVQTKTLKEQGIQIITPVFYDWSKDNYKIISFYAKRARGLMARFCAEKQITQPEKIKQFKTEGYAFDPALSTDDKWVFKRRLAT